MSFRFMIETARRNYVAHDRRPGWCARPFAGGIITMFEQGITFFGALVFMFTLSRQATLTILAMLPLDRMDCFPVSQPHPSGLP